jgi:transcriptional regulator with XRE-family HTH domain
MIYQKRKEVLSILTEIRKKKGWSMYKLARIAGVKQSVISRIENDTHNTGIDSIIKVANALDCYVDFKEK